MLPTVTHTGPGRPCLGVGWGAGGGRMGGGRTVAIPPPIHPTQISHKQLSGGEVRALPIPVLLWSSLAAHSFGLIPLLTSRPPLIHGSLQEVGRKHAVGGRGG